MRSEKKAEHIQIEMLVEMFLGQAFQRGEFIDARVVHQNVEPAKSFFRIGKQALDIGLI